MPIVHFIGILFTVIFQNVLELGYSLLGYTLTHIFMIGIMKVFWGDVKRAVFASLQDRFGGCLRPNSCCMVMQECLKVRLFAVKKWKCASLLRFLVSSKKTKKCCQDRIISFYLNSTLLLLFVPHRTNHLFNCFGNLFVLVYSLWHYNITCFPICQCLQNCTSWS